MDEEKRRPARPPACPLAARRCWLAPPFAAVRFIEKRKEKIVAAAAAARRHKPVRENVGSRAIEKIRVINRRSRRRRGARSRKSLKAKPEIQLVEVWI